VINQPSLRQPHVASGLAAGGSTRSLFIYTRCHSCKNQIVKDRSQQASTAASFGCTSFCQSPTRSCFRSLAFSMDRGGIHALGKAEVRHWPRYLPMASGHRIRRSRRLATSSAANPHHQCPSLGISLLTGLLSPLGGETGNLTRPTAYVKGSWPNAFLYLMNLSYTHVSKFWFVRRDSILAIACSFASGGKTGSIPGPNENTAGWGGVFGASVVIGVFGGRS
jgi:hypothetical protein